MSESGQRFVDVTDPDSGQTFRFYEVEYAVACAMNGSRSVDDLRDWARSELGLEPSTTELETVISTLGDLGYLAPNGANLEVDDLSLGSPGRSPMDSAGDQQQPETEPFELGVAGRSPMGGPPKPNTPEPAPLELGAAGGNEGPTTPAPAPPAAAPLTPPPAPASDDVSTNLGEHLSIGTDDVKEAVRQSKIMEAVPMPEDALHEMERPSQPQTPPPGATPIDIPNRPAPAPTPAEPRTKPSEPPPKPQSSNLTIIVLVVLLVVAAALAGYYFLVYAKGDDTEGTQRPRGAAPAGDTDEAPEIVATLEAGEVDETSITAPRGGKIAWIEAAGAEVSEGAIVAKYRGFEKAAKEITAAVESRDRYKAQLEKATERNDKRKMAEAAADVERKEGDIAEAEDEAQKHVVKAPAAGVITPLAEADSSVKEGDELIKLAVTTGPSATFEVPEVAGHEVGDKLVIADQNDPSLTAECEVDEVAGNKLSVSCPTDSGIKEGAAIVLKSATP